MESHAVTLYTRPECRLCDEARSALRAVLRDFPLLLNLREVNIELEPQLHKRLLAEIPAIEFRGELLAHATSPLRIQAFIEHQSEGA